MLVKLGNASLIVIKGKEKVLSNINGLDSYKVSLIFVKGVTPLI